MSNPFLIAAQRALTRQGRTFSYKSVGEKTYNIETGSTSSTDTTTNITAYKQHVVANQYNYPTLIGKEVVHFFLLATALANKPKTQDVISDAGIDYTVISVIEQEAGRQIVMYKIVAVKG